LNNERIIEIPDAKPDTNVTEDTLDEDYNNFDDYPFDMDLDFEEHPDIANELGDEELVESPNWGF
jgi:hypothetical protein